MGETNSGFTVIETTLFLGISAALVTIALIGTGTLMTSIRFSDSVRTTHAYVQNQYDEILNGVNPRVAATVCGAGSTEPGKSGCLLLGKLMNFDIGTGSLKTFYVASTEIPDLSDPDVADMSDEELIAEVNPVVVKAQGVEDFALPWGAQVSASKRLPDDRRVNTYVLLRSPRSSRLVSYTFDLNRAVLNGAGAVPLTSHVANPLNVQRPTNFCIRSVDSPDPPAAIKVADGQGQNAISVTFDIADTTEECDGN